MWQWIKSTIFKPVANFFSGVVATIRSLFASDQNRPEYQAIPGDPYQNDALEQADANRHLSEQPSVASTSPILPDQSDEAEPPVKSLPMDIYTGAMPAAGVSSHQVTAVMGTLARTCRSFHGFFNQELINRALRQLWQAVIDDDHKTVKRLLDVRPGLLLLKAPAGLQIQSQYTWVTFDVENESALSIAAKRKQINMIKLLLPYYDKLEQTGEVIQGKAEALLAWKAYTIQKNASGEDEIVIPSDYANYALSLINVFKVETFPNGVKGKFSEKTEDALKLFSDILLPKKATKLDDYIDPELLLLALYKAYRDQFYTFQNWEQRDAFCVRMIGLAQSVLTPETAKIFCEGLYYVAGENRKISDRAESLKLLGGESFYRASRESRSGLGIEYLCGLRWWGVDVVSVLSSARIGRRGAAGAWKNYVKQKQQIFGTLRSNCSNSRTDTIQIVSNRAV